MHTKTTATIAALAVISLLVLGVGATVYARSNIASPTLPSQANSSASQIASSHSDNESSQGAAHEDSGEQGEGGFPLAVGTSFTLSSLNGTYVTVGNESASGKATGSFTFKVTGVFEKGYTLSITSGTVTIGSTTYAITSGSVVLNAGGESGVGSGVASNGATFLIRIDGLHGSLSSPSVGQLRLDLMSGTSEFLVGLGAAEAED